MTTFNLSQSELELAQYIWDNRNTPWFFHCDISNISRSNTSREIAVYIISKDNRPINVDELIAALCGYKIRKHGLYVTVHNMDAVFDTLYRLLVKLNEVFKQNENVCKCLSANHYEML